MDGYDKKDPKALHAHTLSRFRRGHLISVCHCGAKSVFVSNSLVGERRPEESFKTLHERTLINLILERLHNGFYYLLKFVLKLCESWF